MNTKVTDFKYISRFKKLLFAVALLFAIPSMVFAGDEKGKSFNAGDMILEHVSDAHSWHVAGDYSIPLPIILYSSSHGFSVFCSNKLNEGAIYNGYKLNGEHIVAANADGSVNKEDTAKLWDFSLTKTAASILLSGIFISSNYDSSIKGLIAKEGLCAPKGNAIIFRAYYSIYT